VASTGARRDAKLQISDNFRFQIIGRILSAGAFRFDGGTGFALVSRHGELHASIRTRDAFDRDSRCPSESLAAEKGVKDCGEQMMLNCSTGHRKRY